MAVPISQAFTLAAKRSEHRLSAADSAEGEMFTNMSVLLLAPAGRVQRREGVNQHERLAAGRCRRGAGRWQGSGRDRVLVGRARQREGIAGHWS